MKRSTALFVLLTTLFLVLLLPTVALAETTLSLDATAAGYYKLERTASWSGSMTVSPGELYLATGFSGNARYEMTIKRSTVSENVSCGVSGLITVTNTGSEPTEGLNVLQIVMVKRPGSTEYQDAWYYKLWVSNELAPGEQVVFDYDKPLMNSELTSKNKYKSHIQITIDNYDGHSGERYGPEKIIAFTFGDPRVSYLNGSCDVSWTLTPPVGFEVAPNTYGPITITEPGKSSVEVAVSNVSAIPDAWYNLTNKVVVESAEIRNESSQVTCRLFSGAAPLVVVQTAAWWSKHTAIIKNLLPQWLGTSGGKLSLRVTSAKQAKAILASKSSDGIAKLRKELLATKLNQAGGCDVSLVARLIKRCDSVLATHNKWSSLKRTPQYQLKGWTKTLARFNSGYYQ